MFVWRKAETGGGSVFLSCQVQEIREKVLAMDDEGEIDFQIVEGLRTQGQKNLRPRKKKKHYHNNVGETSHCTYSSSSLVSSFSASPACVLTWKFSFFLIFLFLFCSCRTPGLPWRRLFGLWDGRRAGKRSKRRRRRRSRGWWKSKQQKAEESLGLLDRS